MDMAFEAAAKDKQKVVAILEADPYGKPCFSRNGYKVKDGVQVGLDKDKFYVYLKATEEFAAFAREKLKEATVESKPEVVATVAKVIADEENNAEAGFGAIFG